MQTLLYLHRLLLRELGRESLQVVHELLRQGLLGRGDHHVGEHWLREGHVLLEHRVHLAGGVLELFELRRDELLWQVLLLLVFVRRLLFLLGLLFLWLFFWLGLLLFFLYFLDQLFHFNIATFIPDFHHLDFLFLLLLLPTPFLLLLFGLLFFQLLSLSSCLLLCCRPSELLKVSLASLRRPHGRIHGLEVVLLEVLLGRDELLGLW